MDVLVIKLGTFAMAVHEKIQSLSFEESSGRYVIIEADGSRTSVKKDSYMITILR